MFQYDTRLLVLQFYNGLERHYNFELLDKLFLLQMPLVVNLRFSKFDIPSLIFRCSLILFIVGINTVLYKKLISFKSSVLQTEEPLHCKLLVRRGGRRSAMPTDIKRLPFTCLAANDLTMVCKIYIYLNNVYRYSKFN